MMSIPPRRLRTASATVAQPSAVVMSDATNKFASARSLGFVRAVVRTVAPPSRNRVATAAPIPFVPPVTRTCLPSNSRRFKGSLRGLSRPIRHLAGGGGNGNLHRNEEIRREKIRVEVAEGRREAQLFGGNPAVRFAPFPAVGR